MSRYIESSLIRNEHVLHTGYTSWWSVAPLLVWGAWFMFLDVKMGDGVGLIVFGLALWAVALIRILTTELAITNKRVIAKFGIIRRSTVELNLNRVESVQLEQGILGRIFNYGSLVVSGAGNPMTPIPNIAGPMKFRRALLEHQPQ